MSENKRSRKYSNLKEHKQRTIFGKTSDSIEPEPPKILLKAKEKPAAVTAVPTAAPASPTITIATREPATAAISIAKPPPNAGPQLATTAAAVANGDTTSNSASTTTATAATASASPIASFIAASATSNKTPPSAATALITPQSQPLSVADGQQSSAPGAAAATAAVAAAAEKVTRMPGPLPLINEHQQLCVSPLNNYLLDTNHQFFVVGVIGTQSAGKSTLLNMLLLPANAADAPADRTPYEQLVQLLHTSGGGGGRFHVQRPAQSTASTAPTQLDAVQMYVSDDRHVLLDCTPLLCNGQKKDPLASEMDDLRLVALMLSVCQTVLVADSGAANMALMRLLHMAELMKPSLDLAAAAATPTASLIPGKYPELLHVAQAHYPSVMFVHMRAEHWYFEPGHAERMRRLYARCFGQSRLCLFGGNVRAALAGGAEATSGGVGQTTAAKGQAKKVRELPLNMFTMPHFAAGSRAKRFGGHALDVTTIVQQFRRWVLMAPRVPFVRSPTAPPMSEKSWGVLVQTVWESHKGSYFFRKYEADVATKAGA